jgi:hypothetical protein
MRKLFLILLLLAPIAAFAALSSDTDSSADCSAFFCNPLNDTWKDVKTIQDSIAVLLSIFIQLMIPVIALSIIYTGYTFATAKGDPAQLKKARTMLTYVVVGTMIILASKGIQVAVKDSVKSIAGTSNIVVPQ